MRTFRVRYGFNSNKAADDLPQILNSVPAYRLSLERGLEV